MKALIICGSTVADVVFATPLIRAVKVQLEDVELHVLADLSVAFTLDENPYVDSIHFLHASSWNNYRRLKREKYDIVINLSEEFKFVSLLLKARDYTAKSIGLQQWLMVNLKIDHLPNKHVVDRMFEGVEQLHLKPDELGLDFFIPEKDKVLKEWLPEHFRNGYSVFCINARYNTRKLTVDRMIELCDKINRPVVLLGSKEDAEAGEVISNFFSNDVSKHYDAGLRELNKRTRVYNACGKFNFNQMASVVKQSRAMFTFDNDFIAVGSALKKEIFGLWGNTILMFGRYPYRTKFTVLENNKVSCRPCTAKGFDSCPKGHFDCMNRIVFDFYLP